jgi:2-polyprenyl-6-methoxyphenol hydroxylase-like FAD-dependent oxidoreductase
MAREVTIETREPDVLIVGGGPVGLMSAVLLARQGVRSTVVERRQRVAHAPKAHVINPRTIEICHAAGLDVHEMYARAASPEDDRLTRFVTRVMDRELGSMQFEWCDATYTPFPRMNLAQPRFEQFLVEAIREQPLISLLEGAEWRNFEEMPDGSVTSSVEGPDGAVEFHSRYLVGADGANSRVRAVAGIAMTGEENVQPCLTISFTADWRPLLEGRPSMFYWALGAKLPGVFLAYDMSSTWTYLVFDAPAVPPTPSEAREIVLDAFGADAPLTISHILPWGLTAQVAERYRAGSVFLAGDAVHRFPPTGGLGLNTGVQDAHNLAWKIAAVLAGRAGEQLLDSYERERRPVAELNTRQSMNNAGDMLQLLGLTGSEEQSIVDAAIEQTYEAFNSLGLQLGFSYGVEVAPPTIGSFTPTARVGDRLAHAWLGGQPSRSALDLLDDRTWTLLTRAPGRWHGHPLEPGEWVRVVDVAAEGAPAAWCELVGLTDGNALLVRPDGHIAARAGHPQELASDLMTKGLA